MDKEWLAAVNRSGWKIVKKRKRRVRLVIPPNHKALPKIGSNPKYARTKRGREFIRCRGKGATSWSNTLDGAYGAKAGDLMTLRDMGLK